MLPHEKRTITTTPTIQMMLFTRSSYLELWCHNGEFPVPPTCPAGAEPSPSARPLREAREHISQARRSSRRRLSRRRAACTVLPSGAGRRACVSSLRSFNRATVPRAFGSALGLVSISGRPRIASAPIAAQMIGGASLSRTLAFHVGTAKKATQGPAMAQVEPCTRCAGFAGDGQKFRAADYRTENPGVVEAPTEIEP